MPDTLIYDAVRSPRGKGRKEGALHEISALRLSANILDAIKERNHLPEDGIEDVIWGCVTQIAEQGGCLARSAVLASEFNQSIPGLTINRFCASGMEAVNLAAAQIQAGFGHAYIAGGVEMMSRVAMGSDGAAIAADPILAIRNNFVPQGIAADLIATKFGLTRRDADGYALESQKRAHAAWQNDCFRQSIISITDQNGLPILDHDELIRPDTNLDTLSKLEPAFRSIGENFPAFDQVALMKYPELEAINHIHHAGNSSGVVDGAAAVLLGNAEFGDQLGLTPRARVRATAKIGSEPTIMMTGLVPATEKILQNAGMEISDIDLFEVNEAFAAVVLYFLQAFDVDPSIVNPNGGAIAMGHPLGATGTILIGTLLDELERADKPVGLATLCVAGGMGAATIIERI